VGEVTGTRPDRAAPRSVVAGRYEEFRPDTITIIDVGRFGVGVVNVGGRLSALTNYCPHRGAPLCRGKITGRSEPGPGQYDIDWTREGEVLRCPWHGWEFEIASGKCLSFEGRRIRRYEVTVEGGLVLIHGV
jgi:nitrite reductase (NADH) small subunit